LSNAIFMRSSSSRAPAMGMALDHNSRTRWRYVFQSDWSYPV
jgi:hypothetical protein